MRILYAAEISWNFPKHCGNINKLPSWVCICFLADLYYLKLLIWVKNWICNTDIVNKDPLHLASILKQLNNRHKHYKDKLNV